MQNEILEKNPEVGGSARELESKSENTQFEVLSPADYFLALRTKIPEAKKRVWLKTMNFEADHVFGALDYLMKESAKKGVNVKFSTDYFALMVTDGRLDALPSFNKNEAAFRKFRQNNKMVALDSLSRSGVEVSITNQPEPKLSQINPGSGRNHIKIAIIDDEAYLGGINISDKDFNRSDCMIKMCQPNLVDALAALYLKTPSDDINIKCTEQTSLLVDSGKKSESIILNAVCQAIDAAKESITLTSQFTLDGQIIRSLGRAVESKKQVVVIVSSPLKVTETIPWFFDRANYWLQRGIQLKIPTFEYPNWLHIKTALIDEKTSQPLLFAGTHNFSGKGVEWGNEEAMIMTYDDQLIAVFNTVLANLLHESKRRSKLAFLQQIRHDLVGFKNRDSNI